MLKTLKMRSMSRQAAAFKTIVPAGVSCSSVGKRAASPRTGAPSSAGRTFSQQPQFHSKRTIVAAAAATESDLKFISRTEVPAFIQRDDMIDQLFRWSLYEAGESGVRNFGMPMKISPIYDEAKTLWGYTVGIYKEGVKLTDMSVSFDTLFTKKHEWVGYGEDGFPVLEGRVDEVKGKFLEIWKLDSKPVDEDLRSTIRAFCTGLVAALNRYYAFGSVFVDDAL